MMSETERMGFRGLNLRGCYAPPSGLSGGWTVCGRLTLTCAKVRFFFDKESCFFVCRYEKKVVISQGERVV